MALYMYLIDEDRRVHTTNGTHVQGILSRKEVERANEGVKGCLEMRVKTITKLAIQFFPDCGAPSETVMASNTTFDFVRLHVDRTSICVLVLCPAPPHALWLRH